MNRGTLLATTLLILIFAACRPGDGPSDGVELKLTTDGFRPDTQFELRFDDLMVPTAAIGQTVAHSPLRIEPMLKGRFTWHGQRSGVFTPDEAPLLATRYRFRLESGLQNLDGRRNRARLNATFETPPFRVTDLRANYRQTNRAPATPRFLLEFNSPVRAAAFAPQLLFDNGTETVPAVVTGATNRAKSLPAARWFNSVSDAPNARTWQERFDDVCRTRREELSPDGDTSRPATAANLVSVSPARPLPAGSFWNLVLRQGLPAARADLRFDAPTTVPVGEVKQLEVRSVTAVNNLGMGKYLDIRLNDSLRWDEGSADLTRLIDIEPPVKLTGVDRGWRRLLVFGEFAPAADNDPTRAYVHDRYHVTVGTDEPGGLIRLHEADVRFVPVQPQVRLPGFSRSQSFRGGSGLPILSVNATHLNIRAKRLTPETVIHTLRGYRQTYRRNGGWGENTALPYDLVPGVSLDDWRVNLNPTLDVAETLRFQLRRLTGRQPAPLFLEARAHPAQNGESRGAQAIIQLTDIGLVWKRHAGGIEAFAFSLFTGQPLANADVSLMDDDNQPLQSATTGGDGIARIPFPEESAAHSRLWLLARHGEDLHALELNRNALGRYGFDIPVAWDVAREEKPRVLVFGDRSAYRPGETAHFKLIARNVGERLEPWSDREESRQARFKIINPQGDVCREATVELSARDSAAWSVSLPRSRPGNHQLRVSLGSFSDSLSFVVREFKPDAFEVKLANQSGPHVDEPVETTVAARYFLGKAVANARVRWTAASVPFQPRAKALPDFSFGTRLHDTRLKPQPAGMTDNGRLDLDDPAGVSISPELGDATGTASPRRVRLLAEVTDLNQQTVSAELEFVQHAAQVYPGIERPDRVLPVGSRFRPRLVGVDSRMVPLTNSIAAELRLHRVRWHTLRVKGAGNTAAYRSEHPLEELLHLKTTTLPATREGTAWTVPGTGVELPELTEAGQYLLEVSTRDRQGRRAVACVDFTVAGKRRVAWDYRNRVHLELIPDREVYRPGDTARILVKTPIEGHALVSKERHSVHAATTTRLTGNAPAIELDITTNDAPNVFAAVTLVRGGSDSKKVHPTPEYRYGYCQLKVENPDVALTVELDTGGDSFRPGTRVVTRCRITDARGEPVPNAEVTLYAVDDGVLQLTDHAEPDPASFFHRPQPLAVATHLSLSTLLPEDPARIRFDNKGFIAGGGGNGGGRPRKRFIPCPLWQPALVTDANGRVTAEFTAPDSLTRYRVIAVAHAGSDRFGKAAQRIEINKPLMIEPVLPAVARVGDRVEARALVINRTGRSGRLVVSRIRAGEDHTVREKSQSAEVSITAGETRTVDFPVEFVATGEALWEWSVRFAEPTAEDGEMTDRVQSRLPVEEAAPLLREAFVGEIRSGTNLLAAADPALLTGRGEVTVRLSTSPLLQAWEAGRYLLKYPYGCAEQTASSTLPWLLLEREPALRELSSRDAAEVRRAAEHGVERLLSMQTGKGGLTYWPGGSSPQLWISAYAGLILLEARASGIAVPPAPFKRLLDYLSREFRARNLRPTAPATVGVDAMLALCTLARAGRAEAGYHESLAANPERLNREGRALLALAIASAHGNASWQDAARQLLEHPRAADDGTAAHFGLPARTLAVELLAARIVRPTTVRQVTDELLARRRGGHWRNTQGNAWVLLALASSEPRTPDDDQPTGFDVSIRHGDNLREFRFPERGTQSFPLTARGDRPLILRHESAAPVYAHVGVAARMDRRRNTLRERGFRITRQYQKISAAGEPGPATDLEVGDSVLVSLKIENERDGAYVAINDPLPASLQALEPEFKSRSTRGRHLTTRWRGDHRETRPDRVLFFRNYLPRGDHEIRYLTRVVAAGDCTAPPARIEEMYDPGRHGLSRSRRLQTGR